MNRNHALSTTPWPARAVPALRYSRMPIRLLVCLAVASVVVLAMHAGLFTALELPIQRGLWAGIGYGTFTPPAFAQGCIVVAICMLPSLVRIESPLVMMALGVSTGFLYMLIVSIMLFVSELALPVAPALLGLALAATSVETLAWSDERWQRRRLQTLETARQQFTDMLVHDLNARMSSILMALSALERQGTGDGAGSAELLATVRASTERILLLTGNLLDIRKMEEGHMVLHRVPVALRQALRECLDEHRSACRLAGVTLAMTDGGADVRLFLDRGIFGRVLANLLWNAIQHAPVGSVVDVGVESEAADSVCIHISNAGRPIPAAEHARVFDAFVSLQVPPETDRDARRGLGLTFCKLAVEAHGGSIAVRSPCAADGTGVQIRTTWPRTRA